MPIAPLSHIAILGAGFAGAMTAAMLAELLPKTVKLTVVDTMGADETDVFYGTVTSPATYNFLLAMCITEPEFLPHTNTAFSLGTHYENWGPEKRSWTQAFHQPLPLLNGVNFQHYLTRLRDTHPQLAALQPYIMSIHAARRGVFAHPREDQKTPLSDVEYGYQFLPKQWRDMFISKVAKDHIKIISANILNIERKNDDIGEITLSNGSVLTADFYIDCTGQNSKLTSSTAPRINSRRISAKESFAATETLGPVCRKLTGSITGWTAQTPLQDGIHSLTINHSTETDGSLEVVSGYLEAPWSANAVTIGHGAALLEPLTPAPIITLQRDIERLAELIPLSTDMRVEAREYNRRFAEDYGNAACFQNAFSAAGFDSEIADDKLETKITQFESRGICVQYDLEPFLPLDWLQLHYGMGRKAERYDPLADKLDEARLIQTLQKMRVANETLAAKMPPHHVYMSGLLKYLRKKNV